MNLVNVALLIKPILNCNSSQNKSLLLCFLVPERECLYGSMVRAATMGPAIHEVTVRALAPPVSEEVP